MLSKILKNLPPEDPKFTWIQLRDRNPLGRTQKVRTIGVPNRTMEFIHSRLIEYLRDNKRWLLPFATGARPYCSPRKNVLRHRFNRFFYLTDLHAAYSSVNLGKLVEIVEKFLHWHQGGVLGDTRENLKFFLEEFCIDPRGGLVTGAPASPDLFNLYAEGLLDRPLGLLCGKHNLTYSRYLDDLTFSSSSRIGEKKRKMIRKIVEDAGFSVNHRKSKVHDLRKGPIEITGVGLEYGGRLFLPRHYLRRIKGMLHLAMRDPLNFQYQVFGMMGLFLGITPSGTKFNRAERAILDEYKRFRDVLIKERYR